MDNKPKYKIIKILENYKHFYEKSLHYLGLCRNLDLTQNTQSKKEKFNKLDFIKIKLFSGKPIKMMKIQLTV